MKVLLFVFAVAFTGHISAKSIGDIVDSTGDSTFNKELVVVSSHIVTPKKELVRQRRQFGPQNFGQSSALANANAFNQYSGPNGFGSSAALAGAQSFNSQGPLGGFGASAANSQSQGFNAGPGGFSGTAGLSGSQNYNLPNGHHVNLAYGGTYGNTNGQGTGGNAASITYD